MLFIMQHAILFAIIWIILLILPFVLSFIFYKKNIKKLAPNFNISNIRVFIDTFIALLWANIITWIISLFILNWIVLLAIQAILFFFILKIILSKKDWIDKKNANQIASNTVWAVYWIMLLIWVILAWIIMALIMH